MLPLILALQTPKIDPGAMALLMKNRDAMFALRGYRAQCRMVVKVLKGDLAPGQAPLSHQFSILTAAKPNRIRYEMWGTDGPKPITARPLAAPDFAIVSDGKKRWMQSHKNYMVEDDTNPRTLGTANEPWDGFYAVEGSLFEQVQNSRQKRDDVAVRLLKREKLDGVLFDKVEIDLKQLQRGKTRETRKIVLLRPDGLVRRQTTTTIRDGSVFMDTANLLRIEKNPDLRRQSFAYKPPKGVKPFDLPKPGEEATSHSTLLANGSPAPDFVAKDLNGKETRLSDLKGKVVVLDFWASWCAPCVASMPHTQSVADKLKKEGLPVVVLAVDDAEKIEAFNAWVKKNGGQFAALNFLYSPQEGGISGKLFKVTGIPTQYIIDANGIIRASFIGYNGETDALEKAVRAALRGG